MANVENVGFFYNFLIPDIYEEYISEWCIHEIYIMLLLECFVIFGIWKPIVWPFNIWNTVQCHLVSYAGASIVSIYLKQRLLAINFTHVELHKQCVKASYILSTWPLLTLLNEMSLQLIIICAFAVEFHCIIIQPRDDGRCFSKEHDHPLCWHNSDLWYQMNRITWHTYHNAMIKQTI